MEKITSLLFKTNAFKICEPNKPFWYTSGKIGPYFINAQYLYGSEKESNDLLDFINSQLENETKENIAKNVFEKVKTQYETNEIYKVVVDELVESIKENIDIDEIDFISGGERRDWFFSMIIAYLLNKPHITIFKDVTAVESTPDFTTNTMKSNLDNKNVLHIADLLNQASSYIRAWIPAIENLGGKLKWTALAVDRMQGGTEVLEKENIKTITLIKIDEKLFEKAKELGIINQEQLEMLLNFKKDPDGTMKKFVHENPQFIKDSLNSDEKTAKRAQLCLDSNFYDIKI